MSSSKKKDKKEKKEEKDKKGRNSIFQRWTQQKVEAPLEGITSDEKDEYKEAFRLFDKVGLCCSDCSSARGGRKGEGGRRELSSD